jgi:hypothetical protein
MPGNQPTIKTFFMLAALTWCGLHAFGNPHDTLSLSQYGPQQVNQARFWSVAGVQGVGYTATLIALDRQWYRDYPRSSFHLHDDSRDWLQMDKLGHTTTAYHLSRASAQAFRWSGASRSSSAWLGAISGSAFLGAVEVLDGFSAQWGFSMADFAANKVGAITFLAQEITWQQQKILWKYSYTRSGLAQYRPALLGSTLPEKMLKDYNGMSFWLSGNLEALTGNHDFFPPWLNLALGHGAYGLLGSRQNPTHLNGEPLPQFQRYRQWYLSPDIDWERISSDSAWLRTLFSVMNVVKTPAPAIEYNRLHGWQFHWFFF